MSQHGVDIAFGSVAGGTLLGRRGWLDFPDDKWVNEGFPLHVVFASFSFFASASQKTKLALKF
jgi:hypothetical protein